MLIGSSSSTKLSRRQCGAWIISFSVRVPLWGMRICSINRMGTVVCNRDELGHEISPPQSLRYTRWGVCRFWLHNTQTGQHQRSTQDQVQQHLSTQRLSQHPLWRFHDLRRPPGASWGWAAEGTTARTNSFPRQSRLLVTLLPCYSSWNTLISTQNWGPPKLHLLKVYLLLLT